ncbi:hypothetical protein [Streptomyces sp. NPDC003393]
MRERSWLGGARRPAGAFVSDRRASKAALLPLTDAVHTHRRPAWLNEAGMHIGATLDLRCTAEELAAFTMPELAYG